MNHQETNDKNLKEKHKLNENDITKFIALGVIAFVVVFIVPLIINWMFNIPAIIPFFAVSWEGKDALSYYGSILGAIATIYALTKTIDFTVKNQREERKLSVKPYLQTYRYVYSDILKIPSTKDIIYLHISKKEITYQAALPEFIRNLKITQDKLLKNEKIDELDLVLHNINIKSVFDRYHIFTYDVENCGAGNAVDVFMKINSTNAVIPRFAITTSKPKKHIIILDADLIEDNIKKYDINIRFEYSDAASLQKYHQTERIIFCKRDGKLKTVQYDDEMLSAPIPEE